VISLSSSLSFSFPLFPIFVAFPILSSPFAPKAPPIAFPINCPFSRGEAFQVSMAVFSIFCSIVFVVSSQYWRSCSFERKMFP
jgi:hypothetical protein